MAWRPRGKGGGGSRQDNKLLSAWWERSSRRQPGNPGPLSQFQGAGGPASQPGTPNPGHIFCSITPLPPDRVGNFILLQGPDHPPPPTPAPWSNRLQSHHPSCGFRVLTGPWVPTPTQPHPELMLNLTQVGFWLKSLLYGKCLK